MFHFFCFPQNSSFPVNQSGSGAGHYSLMETSRRYVDKFKTMGVDYRLQVEDLDVRGLSHVLKTLDRLFTFYRT